MSMDSGKLRETANAAVSALDSCVGGFQQANQIWAEYTSAAFPDGGRPASEALFAGQQKLTELGAHIDTIQPYLDTAEAHAQQVINNEKSNLNAVGLMHGVDAGNRGISENRRAMEEIQQQPAQFAELSAALHHMTDLSVQQTFRNDAVIGELRAAIDHGKQYRPII